MDSFFTVEAQLSERNPLTLFHSSIWFILFGKDCSFTYFDLFGPFFYDDQRSFPSRNARLSNDRAMLGPKDSTIQDSYKIVYLSLKYDEL